MDERKRLWYCSFGGQLNDKALKQLISESIDKKLGELGYNENVDYYAEFALLDPLTTPNIVDVTHKCRNISVNDLIKVILYVNTKISERKES